MDLGRVPALGGPPALIVSAFFFLLDFLDLDLDLALALAFNIFAIMIHPCFSNGIASGLSKARGNYSASPRIQKCCWRPSSPRSAVDD
jgi:hypothetical protein